MILSNFNLLLEKELFTCKSNISNSIVIPMMQVNVAYTTVLYVP